MNTKKIISAALSLIMMLGALIPASLPKAEAAYADKIDADGNPIINYTGTAYATPDDKLADMILVKEQNGRQIWYEEFTGEICFVNTETGQKLFSNPWDVAASYNSASVATKQKLLSQVMISYIDNGVTKQMNSYLDAALRNQITLKNIKNGIRVEYVIGEEQTVRLVPRLIRMERFEELILSYITDDWTREKVNSFYTLKNPFDLSLTERAVKEMRAKFPITEKMAVYVCDPDIKARELSQIENFIKTYCTAYSYEELDKDHQETGYAGQDAAPPLFRLALEYSITADGDLEARLPANGIRFDESAYKLQTVNVLPYFGAGSNNYKGYTFIPDGSGTLIRFEDVKGSTYNVSGDLYGQDYAYHNIKNQHTEVMRWPVYGIVTNYERNWKETEVVTHVEPVLDEEGNPMLDENGEALTREINERLTNNFHYEEDQGFLAIITEGDSLASLMSEHGGTLHCFNTVYPMFTPRPSDQYNLRASISVGANTTWTVTSERKYTGSYRILYKMLTDPDIAAEKGIKDYYSADYMGMAKAYRDYLYANGTLTKLEDTTADLPLYIETFGSMETTKRILSFPVNVDIPLTSFDDIKDMYEELTEAGVGRINFRLTGYANGGMISTIPYKLEWMRVVGGDKGFTDLVQYAAEKGMGLFPDFDFEYVNHTELFDGMSLRKYAVKTIDDRYTSKRYYDAATQSFTSDRSLCVSASAFEHFYTKFAERYLKYNPTAISVSTLGTELNSDFDEDEPYNREDTKKFTTEVMALIDADYKDVMIDGGNAYVLPYANHIMKLSTDSSRFLQASEAIPFMGIVLHGAKYFTGNPINMEGDIDSAILKAIENGSSLYFVLSKQNTNELKESFRLSQYYSVSYEIWKDELVDYYKELNDATKDLQTSLIVEHEFLYGERIPDADEAEADAAAAQAAAEAQAEAEAEAKLKEERALKYLAMHGGEIPEDNMISDEEFEDEETEAEEEVEEVEEEGDYVKTKYTTTKGTIIRVGYEGGVNFLLNYNSFDVTVRYNGKTYTIAALGFVRIG